MNLITCKLKPHPKRSMAFYNFTTPKDVYPFTCEGKISNLGDPDGSFLKV